MAINRSKDAGTVRDYSAERGTDGRDTREARRQLVVRRFSAAITDIGPLFREDWCGAWANLHDRAPLLAARVARAEAAVDEFALSFIQGRSSRGAFEAALKEYQRAWMQTADRIRLFRLAMAESRCADCRRSNFVAGFRDEDGTIWCRRCWSGG